MSIKYKNCKNCETDFKGNFNFCPNCGQKDNEELTLGLLFYNTIGNYLSFDARFFKSFLPLLFRPGFLASKFIRGKRKTYLHPAKMYLFIAIVFFFLFSFNVKNQAKSFDKKISDAYAYSDSIKDSINLELKKAKDSVVVNNARNLLEQTSVFNGFTEEQIDSLITADVINNDKDIFISGLSTATVDSLVNINASDKEIFKALDVKETDGFFKKQLSSQYLKFLRTKKGGGILKAFYDTIPIAMFFVLPIFGLILKLFYRKRGLYAHHLVFTFYFFAFIFLIFSLLLLANYLVDVPDWLDSLFVLSVFLYFVISLKRFYNQGWFLSLFKGILVTMSFFPFVLVAMLGVFFFAALFY